MQVNRIRVDRNYTRKESKRMERGMIGIEKALQENERKDENESKFPKRG